MQVLFAHRRAISEGCCRQRVFTCFCCASSSFVHATRARRASQQLRYATSRFNGVYWNKKLQKFRAGVKFEGVQHYAGYFTNEAEAAYSFDAKLREVCRDPLRLKKSLNFPTEQEQCYEESLLETRSRGLRLSSQNLTKEVESHQRLLDRFSKSPQASEFEILNVPSLSRVDSLFRPLGSKLGGLALQLKSTSLKKRSSRSSSEHYAFQHTSGYGGTLLVLIALDRDMIWMVPRKRGFTDRPVHHTWFPTRPGMASEPGGAYTDGILPECQHSAHLVPGCTSSVQQQKPQGRRALSHPTCVGVCINGLAPS